MYKSISWVLISVLFLGIGLLSSAYGMGVCGKAWRPVISFVEFQSLDIEQQPPGELTIKGKLTIPTRYNWRKKNLQTGNQLPAVVILHGSAGVDFRGNFYAKAFNAAGIATLEIDMWEARGISSAAERPQLPLFTYPDAFSALRFLSEHPNIDPERIGVIGFSWGGAVAMASASVPYASQFGGPLRFAAHVAHYPICYAYNSYIPGSEFTDLTGAPILIQVGDNDDYDEGSGPCQALVYSLEPDDQELLNVNTIEGAYHAWDRLQVPITVDDPFSHRGAGGEVEMIPDVEQAYKSRKSAVAFFLLNL